MSDDYERRFFSRTIPLFAFILKDHLQAESTRYTLDDAEHPEFGSLDKNKHLPNQVAKLLTDRIYRLQKDGKINGHELQTFTNELQSFTDICGACERIKNTPIPFSYSLFIKKFIFFYVMTMPLGIVFSLGYYMIPVVIFVFYVSFCPVRCRAGRTGHSRVCGRALSSLSLLSTAPVLPRNIFHAPVE